MKTPHMQVKRTGRRRHVIFAILALLPGCSTVDSLKSSIFGNNGPAPGQQGYVEGFLGGVVADEPRAAVAGREVLSGGGNAADAAVAIGMTLAVTLPSRAALGGGGACLAYSPARQSINGGTPEAVMFLPTAPSPGGPAGDRPAAVPMMARGLFLLNARYGSQPFETRVAKAEELARFGVMVSKALAQDLRVVARPLFADPQARTIFGPNGAPLSEGDTLVQPTLAATLSQIRFAGVGDLYVGGLAQRLVQASLQIGGPLSADDLRTSLPGLKQPLLRNYRNDRIAFLPPPTDGGLATEAAFDALVARPGDMVGAMQSSIAVSQRWREGGVSTEDVLAMHNLSASIATEYPASTSFATFDRQGNAVACALTMNNLFGTGRIFPGTGILAASSPAAMPPPLLAAGLAWNDNLKAFRAAAAASGQSAAAVGAAQGLLTALQTNRPLSVLPLEPSRVNVLSCGEYLPGNNGTCVWATDPRGSGLALGGN